MKPTITVNDGEIYVGAAVPAHDLSEEAMTTPSYTPEQLREWADTYDRGEVEPGVRKPNRAEIYRAHAALLDELAAAQEALAVAMRERNDAINASLTDLTARQRAEALAESYKRDAERYRWLREQSTADIYACWYPPTFPEMGDTPEQRDAAIDAARKP